ncbi:hypothetical protein BX600DRAFT_524150 [Xylariales sp. PMI_506]|nr:hypothetical protein BX600DRAFT_524150 [Xylariales sp. PMI_506]
MLYFLFILGFQALVVTAKGPSLKASLTEPIGTTSHIQSAALASGDSCLNQTVSFTISNVQLNVNIASEGPYFTPNEINLNFDLTNSITQNTTLCVMLNLGSPDWDADDATWIPCYDINPGVVVDYPTSAQFEWFGGYNVTINTTWPCVDPTTQ